MTDFNLNVITAIINSNLKEEEKKYTIRMYITGWWDEEQVMRVIESVEN